MLGLTILTGCQPPTATAPTGLAAVSFSLGRTPATAAGGSASIRTGEIGPDAGPSDAPRMEHPSEAEPGGGRQGGPPPAGQMTGMIRDAYGVPIPEAVIRLADGREATTERDGSFRLAGSWSDGPVVVSKPGYVTSIVHGLTGVGTLHLRPDAGPTAPFDQARYVVSGTVAWPDGDHLGGVVYYQDSLDSAANPVPLASDGSFTLELTTTRPGTPTGLILVLASNSLNQTLIGLSTPFQPSAGQALSIPMHLADQPIAYSASDLPAATPLVESRLEIRQPGVPPMVLQGEAATAGLFYMPAGGLLPGQTQVVVEARDAGGSAMTRLAMTPAGGAANGRLLPIPSPAYNGTSRKLVWGEVAGVAGYRIAAGPRDTSQPAWEAWLPEGNEIALPDEAWLDPGLAEVTLEVVDRPGLEPYAVAGLRQLRLEPWVEAGAHRVARKRLSL
ncbi:MAG: carboxypeptidase-like regulatory domain-containing protein [Candidatus Sericytochromatia bacterium]